MEKIVKDIRDMPVLMGLRMNQLRQFDEQSRHLSSYIQREEETLMEELNSISKSHPNFDEQPFLDKFQKLMNMRQDLLALSEKHMKKAQQTYDVMDKKIALVDESTKSIAHLLSAELEKSDKKSKKKKRKLDEQGGEGADAEQSAFGIDMVNVVDSNEPLYCTCRKISYGQMVGCENADCPIEWYHFGCVGITAEPKDPWYCPTCIEQQQQGLSGIATATVQAISPKAEAVAKTESI